MLAQCLVWFVLCWLPRRGGTELGQHQGDKCLMPKDETIMPAARTCHIEKQVTSTAFSNVTWVAGASAH